MSPEERPAGREKPALRVIAPGEDAAPDGDAVPRKPVPDLSALADGERGAAILKVILDELEDDKAEDIITIDLNGKTDIADAMIVASGRSQRHVGAVADKVVRRLKEAGLGRVKIEGAPACDWVLIDAEDIIVHLFRPEVRKFYNLERIWSETARAPVQTEV